MSEYIVNGGNELYGEISIQKSKNSVLPIMASSIMCEGITIIEQCPKIADVDSMIEMLSDMGAKVYWDNNDLYINPEKINYKNIDENLAGKFRSSIFLLGALISRCKKAMVVSPGGCNIGDRLIDIHISGLKKLNVKIIEKDNSIFCNAEKMKSADIFLPRPSVGATENLIMASIFINGITNLYNCAREPEVSDLINALNKMGAKIKGAGTSIISIEGVKKIVGIKYLPIPDRIVTGTFLVACAMCRGELSLIDTNSKLLKNPIQLLKNMGATIRTKKNIINIKVDKRLNNISKIFTFAYPYFPTDMQSLFLALSCIGIGKSLIEENLFENRFLMVDELKKMNAHIIKNSNYVIIDGKSRLQEAIMTATDLRAGAALILAGLSVNGKSIIKNIEYIERGYQNFDLLLKNVGADIKKI